jgi:hypothetical protein
MYKTGIQWMNLRKELVVPSKNSYVYKLGFRYAIYWYSDVTGAEVAISKLFGDPNYEWHYTKQLKTMKLRTGIVTYPERRWFWGGQRWGDKYKHQPHWAVFKTEQDRTLALLTL